MSKQVDEQQVNEAQKEDWERLRELELQLQRGKPLELADTVRELLKRTALQVAFTLDDAEKSLRSPEEAATLVMRIRRRIREGSERVGQAMLDAATLSVEGNTRRARRALEAALAEEVVPYYRGLLEALLQAVGTLRR